MEGRLATERDIVDRRHSQTLFVKEHPLSGKEDDFSERELSRQHEMQVARTFQGFSQWKDFPITDPSTFRRRVKENVRINQQIQKLTIRKN